MDLRDHITTETSALAERLIAVANTELQRGRQEASVEIERLERELASLREALQAEGSRVDALTTQLESEAARSRTLTGQLEAESDRANAVVAQLETEAARSAALASELQTIQARLQAAEAARTRLEQEVAEAHTMTDATSEEMSALTRRSARVLAMLNGVAASLVTLSAARATADLFAALVHELARDFERVAIFRVKGNHLEGEHASGLDDSVDIHKIVVPMGLRSVITKAATSGTIERAAEKEIGDARPPFGGSPVSALAAPLVFDGEVLGVAYVESDTGFTDAHPPLAAVLVRHANAVLAGLAQELRAARHLREYARTLLQEAETMFDADVQAGVPEAERVTRLRDSVRFARDLYAQRAALEAPLSMDLLDDEIGRRLRESPNEFLAALTTILSHQERQHASA